MTLKLVEAPIENKRDLGPLIVRMHEAGLTDVLVLGYDRNGEMWSDLNFVDGPQALWLLEVAKAAIIKAGSTT